MTTVTETHIRLDERGAAWIDDTKTKVIEIACDQRAHGWSAEEIYYQHYGHLSLAQIHAALAYYFDHQTQFDQEIEKQIQESDELRAKNLDSPGRRRLRALGKLP
jgi:uncharacterized protein (DUF433 family)